MKGMEISRRFFEEVGAPMIDNKFSEYKKYMAIGLVGEGSECFGFDDEFSKDHDFGPGFLIWLPQYIFDEIGSELQREYDALPKSFLGFHRIVTAYAQGRVGVNSIEAFYKKYTNLTNSPKDNIEWLTIPSEFLATATNGMVFVDYYGEFSKRRNELKAYYPSDVAKKKMAAYSVLMGQSGQYNYPRSINRRDYQAAYLACAEFVRNAMNAIYVLNEEYIPFYKWCFRKAEQFVVCQNSVKMLKKLSCIGEGFEIKDEKVNLIEEICKDIVEALNIKSLTKSTDLFMQIQGEDLMANIEDTRLKNIHIMVDSIK